MSILIRFKRLTLVRKTLQVDNLFDCQNDVISVFSRTGTIFRRKYGGILENFVPFEKVLSDRRSQARRSVVVQVNSKHSYFELHNYCSQFGNVLGVYHYRVGNGQQHFMLVELEKEEQVNALMLGSCFSRQLDTIPVKSPFLWFRSAKDDRKCDSVKSKDCKLQDLQTSPNGVAALPNNAINDILLHSDSITEQIVNLYNSTKLNDIGTRLRFIVARQVESALTSIYPQVSVRPFGSSVNGFGKMGSDLDLLLRISADEDLKEPDSRLVFHTKRSTVTGRMQQQRYMEIVGDIVQLFIPGCSQVRRILQARIPIIKYNQDYAGVECDLSMSSVSGVYMSDLLYTFGCLDDRVRPLVFVIRKWAQSIGITNPSPGKWITNFPLTLMVLFYLQNAKNGPILPSFDLLKTSAEKQDERITDDHIDCTFLRDVKKLNFKCKNTDTLEELMTQFFSYYASFNVHENAISINLGKTICKPDHSSLYIVNPLENTLNVCKNVSSDECERILLEFRNALWVLESNRKEGRNSDWGLPLLFNQQTQMKSSAYKPPVRNSKILQVKDLFVQDEVTHSTKRDLSNVARTMNIGDLKQEIEQLNSDKKDGTNLIYKNPEVKKQIDDIRKHNDLDLRKKQKELLDSFLETNNYVWVKRKR